MALPINEDWVSMIRSMGRQYKEGTIECRDISDGTSVCVSEKAWSVFYATGTKMYGEGFDSKPRPKKAEESVAEDILNWYLRERKHV